MDEIDFSDARVKLTRARKHIADADARIQSFLSTDFYKLRLEPEERGRTALVFDSLHQPNKELNALIGDAISNLRSTLDYIVVALVKPIGGNPENVGFPFADDASGFKGQVGGKKSLLGCAGPIIEFFIDKVQAYKGGNGHILWSLNKLRNIDKHRLLVATANAAFITLSMNVNGMIIRNCTFGVTEGTSGGVIGGMPPNSKIDFTDKPKPSFEVRLIEPPYVGPQAVVAYLNEVASSIDTVLNGLQIALKVVETPKH